MLVRSRRLTSVASLALLLAGCSRRAPVPGPSPAAGGSPTTTPGSQEPAAATSIVEDDSPPALSTVAAPGRFTTLTYNVAGLLEPFSSGSPATNTPAISCRVRGYDVVNVQEDFNYHAALYDTCDDHPFRTETSGGMGFGSGLNTLSRYPFEDFERVKWDRCNGVDCLTPKGFTLARVRLAEGVFVDVYNLHTQAQTADADLAARRDDVRQLARFIEYASAGNAVIVMGDTNTRYTRDGDNYRELLARGFSDVWLTRIRAAGAPPAGGEPLTSCTPDPTSPSCEVVDKVLYRDNGVVGLAPDTYAVARAAFLDGAGQDLSDHWPVEVSWRFGPAAERRLSDRTGGPHGDPFDDVALLPANPVARELVLGSAAAVDRVALTLSTGAVLSHGGAGGDEARLALADGERLTAVVVCAGKHQGRTRVASVRFSTSLGRTLEGGSDTSDCATYEAPAGWAIVGFHGRAAEVVHKLGVVYAPVAAAPAPEAARPFELVNRASGLCLDVTEARLERGAALAQRTCSGGDWQRWTYDAASGLLRSQGDPRLCLDTGGPFGDDDTVHARLWDCTGNAHQRFTLDEATGTIALRANPGQVLDGFGAAAGSPAITWTDRSAANQRWDVRY